MRKILKFPKLTVKNLCVIAMLMAVTTILAISFTFRIGEQIKIPLKFISVFIASVCFGPWIGGLCGAVGDIFNILLVPSGPFLPHLTILEFLSGFIYGILFYNQKTEGLGYILRCILCAAAMFLLDIFLTTLVLIQAGIFPSLTVALPIRLPAGIIKLILQLIVLIPGCKYLNILTKLGGKNK